ncbi:RNA polymerase I-specific initiation factor-domain-containing protein, partial [Protomyces lactucae-debilis]
SQRYQHVEVLVTLIHRCIQTREWERALRGFSLLLRVPDVDIKLCYDMGLEILLHTEKEKAIEYLSRLIVAFPPLTHGTILRMEGHQTPRAEVFVRILTVHRIHQGRFHEAVDALDQWLLVPPFRDDRQLWQLYVAICKELEDQARQADDAAGRVKWKSK